MKKNLTLLLMLAAFVSIASAQSGPKINYQAVVRHHDAVADQDTLFHDQTIDATISVLNLEEQVLYQEYRNGVMTTENGLLSIVIGEEGGDGEGSLLSVDWGGAFIKVVLDLGIDGEDPVVIITPVTAVPYAIQANIGPITTEMIAYYAQNTITDDGMTQILDAIRNNPNGLKDGLKHWVIDYMKDHENLAKAVVAEYLQYFDAQNVQEAYNALNTNANKPQLKALLKQILLDNRSSAMDIALWFINSATADDIERAYETLLDIPADTKQAGWDRLVDYMTNPNNRVVVYDLGVFFIQNISYTEAENAYSTLKAVNPAVNSDLRTNVDYWVDEYFNDPDHPERKAYKNVDQDAVDNAIDKYLENHSLVPKPNCDINICDLEELYESVVEP